MDVAKKIISAFSVVWFFTGVLIAAVGALIASGGGSDEAGGTMVFSAGLGIALLGLMLGLVRMRLDSGGERWQDRPNASPDRSKWNP